MTALLTTNRSEAASSYDLKLAAKPLPAALVDLAVATNISIGGVDPAACGAMPRAVSGRQTPQKALKTLLKDSHCQIERIDDVTYRLTQKRINLIQKTTAAKSIDLIDENEISVVVVRSQQAVGKIPAAISVMSMPRLAENEGDLSRVALQISGMTITNLGPGRNKILLRGLSDGILTGRTQSTVGLYLDDSPITYNSPDPDLFLIDMARVEVLKGPQGNLYGQGALSGVVRLVTEKPRLDSLEGDVSAALGVTQSGKDSSRFTATLNLPLIKDRLAIRGAIYQEKTGGFIKVDDNPDLNAADIPFNPQRPATNNTERTGGRLALLWQASPSTQLTTTLTSQTLNSENSQYVLGQRRPFRRVESLTEPHNNLFQNLSVGLTHYTEAGTLKISMNNLRHSVYSGYDAQPAKGYVSIPNSGILYYDEDQVFHLSSVDASFSSPQSQRFRWLAGVFVAKSTEVFTPHLIDFYTKRTLYDNLRHDDIQDIAAFGKMTYDISPRWALSAGLRVQYTKHATDNIISDVHLINYRPEGHIVAELISKPVSHEIMLSYTPSDQLLIYALSSDGFRTGGFNATTLSKTDTAQPYKGDKLDNFETGLKYQTPDRKWRVNITAFKTKWYDIQSDQLRATGLPITLNIGDGANYGVELDASWRPIETLSLQFSGQYNQSNLSRVSSNYEKVSTGSMPYVARENASLNLRWAPRFKGFDIHNNITLSYRGTSPLNYPTSVPIIMRGYNNLDMGSAIDFGRYTIGVQMTNVTDIQSNSFAYGNPFVEKNQITPLRPRSIWLSLQAHY